jgi:hypothetical protein
MGYMRGRGRRSFKHIDLEQRPWNKVGGIGQTGIFNRITPLGAAKR